MPRKILAAATGLLSGLLFAAPALAGPCENLVVDAGGVIGRTITGALTVAGPTYLGPDGVAYTGVPAFCKVSAVLTPTADSFINVEVWLPTTTWNGRLQGIGNGGYAGTTALAVPDMLTGLKAGFAVATTDMGTAPSNNLNGDALIGHPQKWIDFGWRATHLMTTTAKELIARFYGRGPSYSYWTGCSTGGQQGLMEAQRFPEDYDGILAGAAALNRTHVHTSVLWNYKASHQSPLGLFFSTDQTRAMVQSQLKACAAKSGGLAADPFLTDPRACDWDPAVMQCTGLPDGICLTPEQVTTARAKYAGPRNPRTGKQIYPGQMRGSESDSQFGWAALDTQVGVPFGSIFKWVYGPLFDYQAYDFDTHMATVDSVLATHLNATSTDLSAFRNRGGKIMVYHGWADPLATPQESINYHDRVVAAEGKGNASATSVQKFFRLFMAPGMYHCGKGAGPNAFGQANVTLPPLQADAQHDMMKALQAWVEQGVAPSRVVATKYVNDDAAQGVQMTRPLCVYPNVAKYGGSGDPNLASSFVCAPAPGRNDPSLVTAPEYSY